LTEIFELHASLKTYGRKNLVLRGDYFGSLMASNPFVFRNPDGSFQGLGFDRITAASDFTGSSSKVVGIAWSPSAICLAVGLPVRLTDLSDRPFALPQNYENELVMVPGLEGLPVLMYGWFNLATRSSWMSLDAFCGAAVIDASAAVLIKST
jgi:hypothetical protein